VALGFLIAISLALGLAAWLGFLWAVKSGQYDDPEGPKYRMLEEDDEGQRTPPRPPGEGTSSKTAKEAADPDRTATTPRGRL
jgi:cbb3-type cytochrome oxidase maturation protein